MRSNMIVIAVVALFPGLGGAVIANADDPDDAVEEVPAIDVRKDDGGTGADLVEDDDGDHDRDPSATADAQASVGTRQDGEGHGDRSVADGGSGDDDGGGPGDSSDGSAPAPVAPAPVEDDYYEDDADDYEDSGSGYSYG